MRRKGDGWDDEIKEGGERFQNQRASKVEVVTGGCWDSGVSVVGLALQRAAQRPQRLNQSCDSLTVGRSAPSPGRTRGCPAGENHSSPVVLRSHRAGGRGKGGARDSEEQCITAAAGSDVKQTQYLLTHRLD